MAFYRPDVFSCHLTDNTKIGKGTVKSDTQSIICTITITTDNIGKGNIP